MKKVLIICYYWPPAGGPGVQRWLKFVKYLRDFSIEPVVYVPQNPHYPIVDKSLEQEIPEGITIIKRPIKEPYGLAGLFSKKDTDTISSGIISDEKKQSFIQKILLFIRGNLFVPDARKFWVRPSVRFLENYLKENPVDAIITTGPPHSLHLIGLSLKAKLNTKWIADFRDPWTTIHYHNKLRLIESSSKKHKKMEQEVLDGADHILVTSPGTQNEFETLTQTPISCITNGFDIDLDFQVEVDDSFSLAHIGSLLAERNPQFLWEVLQEMKAEIDGFGANLKLKFAGKVSTSVLESIKAHGLEENVELLGYVTHDEAIQLQRKSQILLLIESNAKDVKAIIPGKVFEYLAARRPIVGIGPQNANFFSIIATTQSGKCFDYSQKSMLKSHFLHEYNRFLASDLAVKSTGIDQYSRKNLTEKLAQLISKVTASNV